MIKELNSLHHKILHNTSFASEVTESEIQALVMAKDLLVQPKTDWIPCEERLPSESGTYLVTDKVFDGESIYYKTGTSYFNGETWHSDFEGIYNGRKNIGRRVIAWSNLPQPYKKEGAE